MTLTGHTLARRRCDVIYAMLRDGTLYETKTPAAA